MTLYSCIEEVPTTSSPDQQLNSKLVKVQNWFEVNKTELRIKPDLASFKTKNQGLILPFFEKEPDWDKFHIFQFPDGREVYEISLANAELYFPSYLADSFPGKMPEKAVIQNIMFVENPETKRFDPLIARYYPDNEESLREFEEIYYGKIDMDWSGMVDIWTYDERHFIGFTIKEGTITSSMQTLSKDPSQVSGTNLLTTVSCREVVVYRNYIGSEGVVTVSFTVTYYCTSGGGSSGDGSSGGGTTDGSYYTYSGGVFTNLDGTSGNDQMGTYIPPSVPAPGIINHLTNPCASEIFLQIKKGSFINSIKGQTEFSKAILELFENFQKYDYVISNNSLGEGKPGLTLPRPVYNSETNRYETQIVLGDEYLAKATKLSIARTIIHESIHAYLQYEQYTDPYGSVNDGLRRYSIAKGYTGLGGNKEHHEFMSQYIDAISYSLQSWDLLRGS